MPEKRPYSYYDKLHRKSSEKLPIRLYVAVLIVCFSMFFLLDLL